MKLITCPSCGSRFMGPKTEKFPRGRPIVFGRWTGQAYPIVVKCHQCSHAMKLTAVQFNGLPHLTAEQEQELGFSTQPAVQSAKPDQPDQPKDAS